MPGYGYDRGYQGAQDAMQALTARAFPSMQTEQNPGVDSRKRMDMLLNYKLSDIMQMAKTGDAQAQGILQELSKTPDLGYNSPQMSPGDNRYNDPSRESLIPDMMYRARTEEPRSFSDLVNMRQDERRKKMAQNQAAPSSIQDRINASVMGEFGY